ncbi:TetR/AcrR family transcriptional regulator [Sphingobium sp. EP60837]|uniref:TetR/AcrR family transcriptional regulator n=1 Tax=Sphingobium sp. EP60837 TaxID=1855519 RepID=UPI0007DD3DEA|nr:TetR/AcrR family transcriptional regulator [Sphingobium sp. EP60837]ANI79261.1 HTH-type transcriptional repressor AcnR [Sphingobium sp. EP60837]
MTEQKHASYPLDLVPESLNNDLNRGRGRPVGDRDAKRVELLDAAISVMAEHGYAGTSLRKVASRAGYSTGAVTYYFANKEAMFKAVTEQLFDRFDVLLESNDLQATLKVWLDWTSVDNDVWASLFQLLSIARHEPEIATIFSTRYRSYRETFASTLEIGQREGNIRNDIPADLLADQITAMADGWMIMRPIDPDRFEPKRVERLLRSVMQLISPI